MKVAIMQPYFLPFLGYFQLVAAVDTFVFFDDVNFITKGWIHRNQLFNKETPLRFTVPLKKPSQNKLINETEISDYPKWKDDFLKQLQMVYGKAPCFVDVYTWFKNFLDTKDYPYISDLASASVQAVAERLDIRTEFLASSNLDYKTEGMNGQDKILSICKLLEAETYVNPKNGVSLYDKTAFQASGINLKFISMDDLNYRQFGEVFHPFLSIIDVLMFNDTATVQAYLTKYQLN